MQRCPAILLPPASASALRHFVVDVDIGARSLRLFLPIHLRLQLRLLFYGLVFVFYAQFCLFVIMVTYVPQNFMYKTQSKAHRPINCNL